MVLWTTFTSDQIDLDVTHPETQRYLSAVLARFQEAGITMIRLDAVGHAVKKAGTSCFMIPETFDFIAGLTAEARSAACRYSSRCTAITRIRLRSPARSIACTTSRCRR